MSKLTDYLKTAFWALLLIQIAPPIIKNLSKIIFETVEPKNKVGLITINSCIMSSTPYCKQLNKFFKDPEIKAILIKMDCPGGAAGSSEAISQEILQLKKDFPKPIITYCENLCASGAYMIASTTDHIIATNNALIGSIGSKIKTQFKVQELLAKYEIQTHSISSGIYKNTLDPFVPMTEEQQKMLQDVVDSSYNQFVHDVAKQRHLNINQKQIWAEGKIFTGHDALSIRLIDEIGNQAAALAYIKKRILHEDREIELVKMATLSRLEKLLYPEKEDDDDITNSMYHSIWHTIMSNFSKQYLMM